MGPLGLLCAARWTWALVEFAAQFVHHAALGLFHAHHPRRTFTHLCHEPTSRKCVQQCFFLNVVLFRGALYVYEYLLPQLCFALLGVSLAGDWRYELAIVVLWAAPAYVICEIISTSLQFKMAQKMLLGAASASADGADAMVSVTEVVYTRLIYYIAFVVQIRLFSGAPLLGPLLTFALSALLFAYDAFDILWAHQGYSVAERFALFEQRWLYFLGYGGVLATLSSQLRFWDLFAIRTAIYPIYMANAPYAHFATLKCHPLPVFQLPLRALNAVIRLTSG